MQIAEDRLDGVNLFMHELGHCFGMNGFRCIHTGQPKDRIVSVFDTMVEVRNGRFYFTGPEAVKTYGSSVPLTSVPTSHELATQNFRHYGNPGDESGLLGLGLMTGLWLKRCRPYAL